MTLGAPSAPKSLFSETPTLTVIGKAGTGSAVIVNVASPPSVMPAPAEMLTTDGQAGVVSSVSSSRAMHPVPTRLPVAPPYSRRSRSFGGPPRQMGAPR